MTQKSLSSKQVSALVQTIDPKEIADNAVRQTVEILLNLIEQLNSKVKDLEEENQKLRDENGSIHFWQKHLNVANCKHKRFKPQTRGF